MSIVVTSCAGSVKTDVDSIPIKFWYSNEYEINDSNNEDKSVIVYANDVNEYEYKYKDVYSNIQFNQLSNDEKFYYKVVMYMTENGYNNIYLEDDYENTSEKFKKAIVAASLDNPFICCSISYLDEGNNNYYEAYILGISDLESIEKSYSMCKEIAYEYNYDIYDLYTYVINNIEYQNVDGVSSVYSTLTNKAGDCDGISKIIQILFNICGYETGVLTKDDSEIAHAWNVWKNNEKYYHLDATDAISIHRDISDVTNEIYKAFFMIPDNIKMKDKEYTEYCNVNFEIENDYSYFGGVIQNKKDLIDIIDNFDYYTYSVFYLEQRYYSMDDCIRDMDKYIKYNDMRCNIKVYNDGFIVMNIWK